MEDIPKQSEENEKQDEERQTPSWIKEEMKRREEIKEQEGQKQDGLKGDVRGPHESNQPKTSKEPEKEEPQAATAKQPPVEETKKENLFQDKKETKAPTPPKRGFPSWIKYLVLFILLAILGVLVYFLFFYKSTLSLDVSQEGAKTAINGEEINPGEVKIRPGTYTLSVKKDGFVAYEKEITIEFFKVTPISVILKEEPKLIQISEQQTKYLIYNQERDTYIYFVPKENAFYRVENSTDERKPILSTPKEIKNVVDVIWNPDGLTAILKIKNSSNLVGTPFRRTDVGENEIMTFLYDFGRYDLLNQEAHFWGTGIGDVKFTPDGNQVAYYYEPGTGEKSLVVANKNNGDINRVLDMRSFTAAKISWAPDLKNILIANQSTDYDNNQVYRYDLIQKELLTLTDSGRIIGAVFGPDSKNIVYSTYLSDPDFHGFSVLSAMNKTGEEKKELGARAPLNLVTFAAPSKILVFDEEEKNKYVLKMVSLDSGEKINYVFPKIDDVAPESIEYIEAQNNIIFTSKEIAYTLNLVTSEYE